MAIVGPVLSLLRETTGDIHGRLERRVNAVDRLAKAETRDDLVRRYHSFHRAVESAVEPLAAGPYIYEWRRLHLIEDALTTLGLEPLPSPPATRLANREQALGALYVLNGSTLGGRMILKDLARRGSDFRGLGFLDPHGDAVGEAWRAFVDLLETEVTDADEAAVGALQAFAQAEDILCMDYAA